MFKINEVYIYVVGTTVSDKQWVRSPGGKGIEIYNPTGELKQNKRDLKKVIN